AGLDWDWSPALYGDLLKVTGGKERIKFYLDEYNTAFVRPEKLDDFIAQLHASKTAYFTTMLKEGKLPLRPGVERLINEARAADIRLAIATTTTQANITALLEHAFAEKAQSWFECVAAGDIVPAKKPAPDIYHYVLEQMNVSAKQCLALEDSCNGNLSSVGAGIPTVITYNNYTHDDDFTGAALVVDQLGDPDQAFNIRHGEGYGASCVDLSLLQKISFAAQ
ncbi:MAG: HAD-IA family hydrolase, partial [Gammaproteobacteria bacterium]|nr:HAD-IA family hydrolase [Gammaproteobacteria bacterium]